jgi:hypothetical protein
MVEIINLNNRFERYFNKLEMKALDAYQERVKAVPIGRSWTYRNFVMAAAEILSGNSYEQSAFSRIFGTLTNFVTAPVWEAVREYGQKKTIGDHANPKLIKRFDKIYGLGAAAALLFLDGGIYHFVLGTKKYFSKETFVPALVAFTLTAEGNVISRAADTWMDEAGIKKENSRTFFALNTSQEEKTRTINLLNTVSAAALYLYLQPYISSTLERIM